MNHKSTKNPDAQAGSRMLKIATILGPALLFAGIIGLALTFIRYEGASDERLNGILMWGSAAANGLIITALALHRRIQGNAIYLLVGKLAIPPISGQIEPNTLRKIFSPQF